MTIIVADTTSSLPLELAKQLDIPMIPQQVVFGEQSYRDDELSTAEFLKRLKASAALPKTAAPIHSHYTPIFSEAAKRGEAVLVIAPSGKISGTVRSAETARQDFPGADIRIIDTQTVAGCLGALVLEAHDMAEKGASADEIETKITQLSKRARTYFVVDTLEYLQKGGRIGAARALLGELLQVKPILQIKDGQASPFEQERTKKRALARLIDLTCDQLADIPDPRLSIMHIDAEDEAMAMRKELSARLKIQTIPLYLLPAAIVVHAGPKALAIGFFG
ncbi:MAG TPA: DegV family protein [Anaerolineales bacterium]|jgi:DegV family protein with EDD domain